MAGIYIHIPFCKKKCNYCSFVSYDNSNHEDILSYFKALLQEIELVLEQGIINEIEFDTIYFGGGTPSFVPINFIEDVLNKIYKKFALKEELEISMECNPDSVTKDKIKHLMKIGINRISLGTQDMSKRGLKLLGRIHSVKDTQIAVQAIKETGIENLSVDLIYCLPGQDEKWLLKSIKRLLNLDPKHISAYELAIEKGTKIHKKIMEKKLEILDQERSLTLTKLLEDFLAEHNFQQYEISNFAQKNYECKHNISYWRCEDYLGIGCGAVSFLKGIRYFNKKTLHSYIKDISFKKLPYEYIEQLDRDTRFKEAFVIGLRMTKGINIEEFKYRFQIDPIEYYKGLIERFCSSNHIKVDLESGQIRLTDKGRYISNYILSYFV